MKPESLLGIALELIETLLEPGGFPADARMGKFFRQRRFLGSRDRRFLSEAAYAWLRHFPRARGRWEAWAARCGQPSLASATAAGDRALLLLELFALASESLFPWSVDDTVAAAQRVTWENDAEKEFVTTALKQLGDVRPTFTPDDWPVDVSERHAAEMSLPVWLADALRADYSAQGAETLATAVARPATVDLRVNSRLVTRANAQQSLEEELSESVELTRWSPMGLRLKSRKNLTGTRASRKGWIEVSDEGSQVVALALDVQSGMSIIDACAGAGGKTLTLADTLLGKQGTDDPLEVWNRTRIYACDVLPHKLEELSRRATDAGVEKWLETIVVEELGPLPDGLPPADVVLVDAPCSGLGAMRRNADVRWRIRSEDPAELASTQSAILAQAAQVVSPGGSLVYSTCTVMPEENEDVIQPFLAAHPEFRLVPAEELPPVLRPLIDADGFLRCYPHLHDMDGFFAARLERVRPS